MSQNLEHPKISQLVARCWADASFKHQLLTNPRATLVAEGVAVPDGLEVRAVENTATVFHWVLPRQPDDLSDDALSGVAAGASCYGPAYGDDWYKALGL